MAGEATLITNPDFDVNTTTLKKFIDMYQDESGNSADYKKKFLNLTKKGKPLEKYLNSPIKDIFEDGDAFANFYDSEAKRLDVTTDTFKNSIRPVSSYFKVLEDNYNKNLEKKGIAPTGTSIFSGRVIPDKPAAKSVEQIVKPRFMGKFQVELMKDVARNPKNASLARASLVLMNTGMRPNEILGLKAGDIQFVEGSAGPGLVRRASKTGRLNVALGPRSYAILQQQLADLQSQGIEIKANTPLFKGIDDKVLTPYLKTIKVPGIVELADGTIKDTITSYDLRRLHATAAYNLRITPDEARTAKGSVAGKSVEIQYIAPEPGMFEPEALEIPSKIDNYYFNLLQNEGDIQKLYLQGGMPPNYVLDPNTDVFRVATGQAKFKVMPNDKRYPVKTLVQAPKVDPKAVFEREVDTNQADVEPKGLIEKFDDLPPHIKSTLKGILKTTAVVFPPVGALMTFSEAKAEGFDTVESAALASTEFAPLSYGDVKAAQDVAGFIDEKAVKPITKPVAEAASEFKEGFLSRLPVPSFN